MTLLERLTAPGAKRILALDGGGIRGALTLGFLEEIETLLRKRYGKGEDFRLSHYFDLIGGTSTGAIIAAGLATGMKVSELANHYQNLGGIIFGDRINVFNINEIKKLLKVMYDATPLETALKEVFGDIKLGDERIKTGLCVVAKRADKFSPWFMYNHPNAKYYDDKTDVKTGKIVPGNKHFPLRDIVRASAAAPTYFLPVKMDVGDTQKNAVFIDGGVSMHNNPALQLFLMATLKAYGFNWQTGEENLFILSLGTGTYTKDLDPDDMMSKNMLSWAASLPDLFMEDATYYNQTLLQLMGRALTPVKIDSELGDLGKEDLLGSKLFTYARYNVLLESEVMKELNLPQFADEKTLESLRKMDDADQRESLYKIGQAAAEKYVKAEHFEPKFDPVNL
ncbi:MAG: patatin-like phospholipase family protein [Saprospiraceae bacterium]|nr:patatin-like phospholipase family protein [Saprospiraceae bacterium]